MNFTQISKEEVKVGDWFYDPRFARTKQKIPKIDSDLKKISTIVGSGSSITIDIYHPSITFYRNTDNPPTTTQKSDRENTDKENDEITDDLVEFLTQINGVGENLISNIEQNGITTLSQLYSSDPDELESIEGLGSKKIKEIKLALATSEITHK